MKVSLSMPVLDEQNDDILLVAYVNLYLLRQMFTSMIENLTPDMMETMSQEFRLKLAQENAQNARQVLLSLSPDDLDKMVPSCTNYALCGLGL